MVVDVPVWVSQPLVPSILLQRPVKPLDTPTNSSNIKMKVSAGIVGVNPSYLTVGGLVFTVLTREYIHSEFHVRDMDNYDHWCSEFLLLSMLNKPKSGQPCDIVWSYGITCQ